MTSKPNIVIIMTDQQRADICAREGFPLDTTPFLDSLARQGTWFNHAYTSMPACLPARVSMLTGRYPASAHTKTNHNGEDAYYKTDLVDVLKTQGYHTAMCGKNHSHLTPSRVDYWFELSHGGGWDSKRTEQEVAFDHWLTGLNHRASLVPTPFPLECQGPYRSVSAAENWISSLQGSDQPFFLWLTFAEPHNPYQVPEPYFSMFPPEVVPPNRTNKDALAIKGFKFQWTRHIGEMAFPDYDIQLTRARSNYMGMLRLIDDQIKRFVGFLDEQHLRENTILVFVSDHGDFVGEYGLVRKGPELPEVLARIPYFWTGPGIQVSSQPNQAFVNMVDIMPTLCDALGLEIPAGVQGRSIWPVLTGQAYPKDEFESTFVEQGFGGLHYTADDPYDPHNDGLAPSLGFDELNGWSQSGTMRALIKGPWKLIFDMMGKGQLYNLDEDPVEMNNLYDQPGCEQVRSEMLADMLSWTLRMQDPLPYPRRRYQFKSDPKNYYQPHKK